MFVAMTSSYLYRFCMGSNLQRQNASQRRLEHQQLGNGFHWPGAIYFVLPNRNVGAQLIALKLRQ